MGFHYYMQDQGMNMSNTIMVQGTMSGVGKSVLAAGLCRIFRQDGFRAAPFKSQNMALNSFITEEGLEIGRAQAMQAEAAKIRPSVDMNPILLKPTSDMGSQVIVNGKVRKTMQAKEYFTYKTELIPEIREAFFRLKEQYDIVVIEGAGSPAEINLKQNDIVNMGMAQIADAPVLLAGDIDRGGVFAQLCGTAMLLEKEERERIKGVVINKFRGDKSILDPGLAMLEEKIHIPVVGVIPYMRLDLDDEDSLSERLERRGEGRLKISVIRFPRISNFTDFAPLESLEGVNLAYVTSLKQLEGSDLVLLPGTKNTIEDLLWFRQSGLEGAVLKLSTKQVPVFGICGGYQMMGEELSDPDGVESGKGTQRGMGLLPVRTRFAKEKTRKQTAGKFPPVTGIFSGLTGQEYEGYEIHMGETFLTGGKNCCCITAEDGNLLGVFDGNCGGTYLHGIFDRAEICREIVGALLEKKGLKGEAFVFENRRDYKEREYDRLAQGIRENLDMKAVYGMMGIRR